ncbi:MAG: hypothetical protein FWG50_14015 [Kiritimatiellaeota bacterium]|nr:hypothetical protein [Kiritimatiellota bacterium]
MKTTQSFITWSQDIHKKRSVYRFGGTWGQALSTTAPWVSAIILVAALFAVHDRIAITPGVVFELPAAPLTEGSHGGLTVLMVSLSRETQMGDETLVFFDDERYLIHDEEQAARLAERLSESVDIGRHQDVLLLADTRVPHGDVIRFVNMARKAGAKRVNVAEKAE